MKLEEQPQDTNTQAMALHAAKAVALEEKAQKQSFEETLRQSIAANEILLTELRASTSIPDMVGELSRLKANIERVRFITTITLDLVSMCLSLSFTLSFPFSNSPSHFQYHQIMFCLLHDAGGNAHRGRKHASFSATSRGGRSSRSGQETARPLSCNSRGKNLLLVAAHSTELFFPRMRSRLQRFCQRWTKLSFRK
jgi:hypothetical protein